MKAISCISVILLILLMSSLSVAQDFSFTCDSLVQPGELGTENEFIALLTNNTDERNIIRLDITDENIPEEWGYFWCVGFLCLPQGTISFTDTLAAGVTDTVFVHIMPEEVERNGSISITAVPQVHASRNQILTFKVDFELSAPPLNQLVPERFLLAKAYPNPFNPGTTIHYRLASSSSVEVVVYNQLGLPVRNLFQGWQSAANYSVYWDGEDFSGVSVPTGLYLVSIKSPLGSKTLRLVKIQ